MARTRLRSRRQTIRQAHELAAAVRAGLAMLPSGADDPLVIDAVWQGEALGTLVWALGLAELPPFDVPFDREWLVDMPLAEGALRPVAEIEHARETARLWHWRARTTLLRTASQLELPERWQSVEQLVAATAMRNHDQGLLPEPVRGDFPALGGGFRELSPDEHAEILSIAYERHRALNWLCRSGRGWALTPTDT